MLIILVGITRGLFCVVEILGWLLSLFGLYRMRGGSLHGLSSSGCYCPSFYYNLEDSKFIK